MRNDGDIRMDREQWHKVRILLARVADSGKDEPTPLQVEAKAALRSVWNAESQSRFETMDRTNRRAFVRNQLLFGFIGLMISPFLGAGIAFLLLKLIDWFKAISAS